MSRDPSLQNITKAGLLRLLLVDDELGGRMSELLLKQLHTGILTDQIHAQTVMEEIKRLEGGRLTRTEKETPFKGDDLRGLWKKHFMQANHIAQNIMNESKIGSERSQKFEALFRNLAKKFKDPEQLSAQIAHALVVDGYEKRASKGRLTGEWIIFAKHAGENYYLSIAFHSEKDSAIRRRIIDHCVPQFHFLNDLLAMS